MRRAICTLLPVTHHLQAVPCNVHGNGYFVLVIRCKVGAGYILLLALTQVSTARYENENVTTPGLTLSGTHMDWSALVEAQALLNMVNTDVLVCTALNAGSLLTCVQILKAEQCMQKHKLASSKFATA